MVLRPSQPIAKKCITCPSFLTGKFAGTAVASATHGQIRPIATETPASQVVRSKKQQGDISSVFTTFSGRQASPLPDRFMDLKRNLTAGFEQQIQKSWDDLVEELKVRTEEVATQRDKIIPIAQFGDIKAGTVPDSVKEGVRRTGVVVVRGVMPKDQTEALLQDTRDYFAQHKFNGFPPNADKRVVFESYWSKSQVKARSHPNMLAAQTWMNQQYHAAPDQLIDLSTPMSYCDRVQIRPPGDKLFALSPHVDGGGVERWEDKAYNHVYRKIFQGKWREYDPFDLTGRLDAQMNMYDGPGGCSVFRTFQGWLGLSRHGPQEGTLVVHPILQPSTAYWMLRPFFKPTVKGSLDGWKFSLDDDDGKIFLHGATPGTAQEHTPDLHPHLRLQETMIPYPTVEPGDCVFWSADTIHGTEMENTGNIDACVFYIPSVPLTLNNAQYIAQQRSALQAGAPPPDFPGGGSGTGGESTFPDRGQVSDIQSEEGKRAMGLAPLCVKDVGGVKAEVAKKANEILGFTV
ncbi:hypothetical protein NCC49_006106 [Naganishia albida]|nr:hypothetical protein NCC49_006106 [Naganishia albida]